MSKHRHFPQYADMSKIASDDALYIQAKEVNPDVETLYAIGFNDEERGEISDLEFLSIFGLVESSWDGEENPNAIAVTLTEAHGCKCRTKCQECGEDFMTMAQQGSILIKSELEARAFYAIPDRILHSIAAHGYRPHEHFMKDLIAIAQSKREEMAYADPLDLPTIVHLDLNGDPKEFHPEEFLDESVEVIPTKEYIKAPSGQA